MLRHADKIIAVFFVVLGIANAVAPILRAIKPMILKEGTKHLPPV